MNSEITIDIIDRYLEGTANTVEKQEIEARLNDDLDFKNEFEAHKATIAGIQQFRRAQLKATLQKELRKPATGKVVPLYRRYSRIAIVAIVLIIAGTIFYNNQDSYQNLYAEFEPDRMEREFAGGPTDEELRRYKLSFESYIAGTKLAKEGFIQAGIDTLASIPANIEYYYFWAQYEIALAHLLNEDSESAKEQLEFLIGVEGEHIAKEKAEELLSRLK